MTQERQEKGKRTMKEWPTPVVLSVSSGRLLCEFGKMHKFVEWFVGSPTWTHQFAHRPFVEELKREVFRQHPTLRAFDADSVTTENWRAKAAEAVKTYGEALALHPMGEPQFAGESFTEPLKSIGSKR